VQEVPEQHPRQHQGNNRRDDEQDDARHVSRVRGTRQRGGPASGLTAQTMPLCQTFVRTSFSRVTSVAEGSFGLRVPVMVHLCRVVDRGAGE